MVAGADGGCGLGDLIFFLGGGNLRQKGVRSEFEGEAHTLEDTLMNFWQVINQNVEKKKKRFINRFI